MPHPRRAEVRPKDLQGLKYFQLLGPLLDRLHGDAAARDHAGNRQLFFDPYAGLLLLTFFSPILTSLRALQQASGLAKVQKLLGCERAALGSLSEASRVFDPALLRAVIGDLAAQALPKMAWTLWRSEERALKMHLQFDVLKGVPSDAPVTCANGPEIEELRATLQAGPDQTVTASAGNPYPTATVSFNGGYSDPGATVSSSGVAWDFNYNGSSFNTQATGTLTPSWTYYGTGTYQVALQVTDGNGATDLSVMQVTVAPPQYTGPTATAGPDQTINEGATATFSGSCTDPDGTVNSSNIAWDFNYDGENFQPQTNGTLTPSHAFDAPGTYQVALQVTDSNGLSSLDTLTVTVNAVAPTVSLSADSSSVQPDQPVSFTALASDPGGSSDAITYAWDFDYDGQNFVPDVIGSGAAKWDFTQAGAFTAAVRATDEAGVSTIATDTITVTVASSLVAVAWPDQAPAGM